LDLIHDVSKCTPIVSKEIIEKNIDDKNILATLKKHFKM
jgi:hypothetical protein